MAKSKQKVSSVELRFPAGGLVRQSGYQSQHPFTTADCNNVRATDVLERRERGGRRPGLVKAYASRLSASAIQSLQEVSWVDAGTRNKTLFGLCAGSPFRISGGDVDALVAPITTEDDHPILLEDNSTELLFDDVVFKESSGVVGSIERAQKVYVADYGPEIISGAGQISGNVLTSDAVSDWASLGINARRDVLTLVPAAGSSVEVGTYEMGTIGTTDLSVSGSITDGECTFRVSPGIKVFDPSTGAASLLTSTDSEVPHDANLIALYRDRIVVAGDFIWYMSRQGDPTDWNYGADATDLQRAVAGTSADAGLIGQPLTALMPHSDDYLVIGTESQLWVMRGDPAYGGQIDNLSSEIGVLNANSWCKLPDGTLVFLARQGVFAISPGAVSYPTEYSSQILPKELINMDADDFISMDYDVESRGIHVSITPSSGTGKHFWIDIDGQSYWPISFSSTSHQPTVMATFASDNASDRRVILGGRDGYLYRYDESAHDDDGQQIESHIILGPLRLNSDFDQTIVTSMTATLDAQSSGVTWTLLSGSDGESVVHSPNERASGVWSNGRNRTVSPRVADGSFGLKISGSGRWAFETASLLGVPAGMGRPSVTAAVDSSIAISEGRSMMVDGQETEPQDVRFSRDGLICYVVGFTSNKVWQYTLTRRWDTRSGYYSGKSFDFTSQETSPASIEFNPDGTRMWMCGDVSGKVHAYTLSTNWDVSTATYDAGPVVFAVAAAQSVVITDLGRKMYVSVTDAIHQYTLSTPYLISSAGSQVILSTSGTISTLTGININSDGTVILALAEGNNRVHHYSLSTAYDLSTATLLPSIKITSEESQPRGIALSQDNHRFYVVGRSSDSVHQYRMT